MSGMAVNVNVEEKTKVGAVSRAHGQPITFLIADWGSLTVQFKTNAACEGDGDVVGVVTPLRGVAQVVLHGVQVVEVGLRLRVHQDRGVDRSK